MSYSKKTKYPRIILVHPPEAERVANAFRDSRTAAELDLAGLERIRETLEQGWEGNQKARFLEEFDILAGRIRKILLFQLQLLENKFRDFTVEQTMEEDETG
jgi:hypothetical protein